MLFPVMLSSVMLVRQLLKAIQACYQSTCGPAADLHEFLASHLAPKSGMNLRLPWLRDLDRAHAEQLIIWSFNDPHIDARETQLPLLSRRP